MNGEEAHGDRIQNYTMTWLTVMRNHDSSMLQIVITKS